MCWFCKKPKAPKTAMELFEEQLKWHRDIVRTAANTYDSKEQLKKMDAIIMDAAKLELNKELEGRLKSIEDAISDLYLTGREDK